MIKTIITILSSAAEVEQSKKKIKIFLTISKLKTWKKKIGKDEEIKEILLKVKIKI